MKIYSVKEIADMLGTNPETIRRWVRSGKLKAIQETRKDGNTVSEDEFKKFLRTTPKYANIAAKSLIATPLGLPVAFGSLIGELMLEYLDSQEKLKKSKVSSEEIEKYFNIEIAKHRSVIKEKDSAVKKFMAEIEEEKTKIEDLKKAIIKLQEKKGELL